MRILTYSATISRCFWARRFPLKPPLISLQRIEFLHTSPVLGIIQRKKWNEKKIRDMDKLPDDYTLIYRNPMYNYVTAVTYITSGSFLAIGIFAAHALITGELSFDAQNIEDTVVGPLTSDITEVYIMGGFFILMNVILRITLNRFPLRIYRKGQEYLAIYTWRIPFRNVVLDFRQGDAVKVPERGILWKDSRYTIKGRKNILLSEYFKAPIELHTMLTPIEKKKLKE
uniref:Putative conserved plasma membrane protein n=1 Tax=Lutzomyia longipalpis TaxID=7200 RepID=A0A7G3A9F8_LUTLO